MQLTDILMGVLGGLFALIVYFLKEILLTLKTLNDKINTMNIFYTRLEQQLKALKDRMDNYEKDNQ